MTARSETTDRTSPRPWKRDGLRIEASNGYQIASVNYDFSLRGKESTEEFEYASGNTNLIVRAVNAHDELSDALVWIEERCRVHTDSAGDVVNDVLRMASATLARVNQEAG